MKSLKASKGITLVALVITIIILLILAGISISALTNQGLFIQAQNAKNLTEEKTAEENAILTSYLEQMNAIIGEQVTESVPDGATVTPVNDITTWLKTGEISKQYSYTTIEQVIADTTCTKSLMNNENAMKYLARSTEFADAICASETAMTSLGQSAYVDDTVLNSDLWKQKIKSSQYWSLIYASKIVTVYGAAAETITIEGYYGSFTTGTDGSCSHVVPIDTITLTGSVSGQSFERTVTSDTTEVYAMPDGALYWYGNLCEDVTGGWSIADDEDAKVKYPFTYNTNYMTRSSSTTASGGVANLAFTNKEINIQGRTIKVLMSISSYAQTMSIVTSVNTARKFTIASMTKDSVYPTKTYFPSINKIYKFSVTNYQSGGSIPNKGYIGVRTYNNTVCEPGMKVHAVFLE